MSYMILCFSLSKGGRYSREKKATKLLRRRKLYLPKILYSYSDVDLRVYECQRNCMYIVIRFAPLKCTALKQTYNLKLTFHFSVHSFFEPFQ